jgi:hypothetical protein
MKRFLIVVTVGILSLLLSGCECLDSKGDPDCALKALIGILTDIAYGERKSQSGNNSNPNGCATLKCSYATDCRFLQQDGSFEVGRDSEDKPYWFGDPGEILISSINPRGLVCDGIAARDYNDLTQNSFRGRAAQEVQVIDLRDHLTPEELQNTGGLRVRALGNFSGNRAGLHLAAYSGDPEAFLNQNRAERQDDQADPETFPVQTADYALLDSAGAVLTINDEEGSWTPIETQMQLPAGTVFITVIVETYNSSALTRVLVDNVQVAVDRGNAGPSVADDRATTRVNAAVSIFPLSNDFDYDGFIDPSSFRIHTPPGDGAITFGPSPSGAIEVIYTPSTDYTGVDAFSYEISDDEGVFREATVSIFIVPDDALVLSVTPDTLYAANRGEWYTATINVARSALIVEDVFLSVQPPAPYGIRWYFDPQQLNTNVSQSTLYISVDVSAPDGAYPLVIRGAAAGGLAARDTLLLIVSPVAGQTVISDSTYFPADWSVQVVTAFGASETHEQRLTGGNPGAFRYMEHILPAPPGLNDLARVEVTHFNVLDFYRPAFQGAIDHIDYAEDIRLINLSWNQAFIVSYPAIRQNNRFYRATKFLSVIADTAWQRGSITGLKATDFVALDGAGGRPDFSEQGAAVYFGFWRISTRGATQPPIPANQNLVYQHGSDNLTITIHSQPSPN